MGSEESNYELLLSGYDASTSTMPDAFALGHHINAPFTTQDRDNDDRQGSNCAPDFSGGVC